MTLLTSRALSSAWKSGFSTPAWPTRASTAVPPRAGFGTVATGWQAASARVARITAHSKSPPPRVPATKSRGDELLRMCRDPDVGERADQEGGGQHPRSPVDLPLEPTAGAIPAAEPIAATADCAAEACCLRRLDENAGHQKDGQHRFGDDQRVLDLCHCRLYLYRPSMAFQLRVLNHAATYSAR